MKHLISQAHDFHKATQAAIYDGKPRSKDLQFLRENLLRQEIGEADLGMTMFMSGDRDTGVEEMVDGSGDVLYIIAGTAVAYGPRLHDPISQIEFLSDDQLDSKTDALSAMEAIRHIKAEFGHYQIAETNNRLSVMGDSLAKMASHAIWALGYLGYDPRAVVNEIHDSNMSKLLKDEADEDETVRTYGEMGVKTECVGEYPMRAILSAENQHGADGKDYPAGKVLKSIRWRTPDFRACKVSSSAAA